MKYTIEKLTKRNGDITYRHKENAGAFSNYSSSPTLSKSELQGFRLVSRIENWRGSGNTVFQKMEKFVFDSKGAKKAAQPAIVYRTRAKPSNPWTVLPNDSTFPDTDPFYVKEVHEDNFSTKKLAGVASSNKPCIKTEDVPEEYHGETLKIVTEPATFETDNASGESDALLAAISEWDSDPIAASLKYGDIKDWDVSAVEQMRQLFRNTENITTLDLSGWDVSNVLDVSGMFYNCTNIESINISGWDLKKCKSLAQMFYHCENLTSVDLSNIELSYENKSFYQLFYNCEKLKTLDLGWTITSGVNTMQLAFANMYKLESITFGDWDLSQVGSIQSIFVNAHELTSLDMTGWSLPSCKSLRSAFARCYKLETIGNIQGWNIPADTNSSCFSQTFSECYELSSLNFSSWNVNVKGSFQQAFEECRKLTNLDLSGFDTSECGNMTNLFLGCVSLQAITFSDKWTTENVGEFKRMFQNTTSLLSIAGTTISEWCTEKLNENQIFNVAQLSEDFFTNSKLAEHYSEPDWGSSCS